VMSGSVGLTEKGCGEAWALAPGPRFPQPGGLRRCLKWLLTLCYDQEEDCVVMLYFLRHLVVRQDRPSINLSIGSAPL
jgi:hypothetical protein